MEGFRVYIKNCWMNLILVGISQIWHLTLSWIHTSVSSLLQSPRPKRVISQKSHNAVKKKRRGSYWAIRHVFETLMILIKRKFVDRKYYLKCDGLLYTRNKWISKPGIAKKLKNNINTHLERRGSLESHEIQEISCCAELNLISENRICSMELWDFTDSIRLKEYWFPIWSL